MKRYTVWTVLGWLLCAATVLAISRLNAREAVPSFPSQEEKSQEQPAKTDQDKVKAYAGRVTKSNGTYVLQDSSLSNAYVLDNQESAKKYEGKSVVVTGVLDPDRNMIHVKKIVAIA